MDKYNFTLKKYYGEDDQISFANREEYGVLATSARAPSFEGRFFRVTNCPHFTEHQGTPDMFLLPGSYALGGEQDNSFSGLIRERRLG